MSIQSLASDIAARVPEMAKDCTINNAILIQDLIEKELLDQSHRDKMDQWIQMENHPQMKLAVEEKFKSLAEHWMQ
jgi:hypothetical protein